MLHEGGLVDETRNEIQPRSVRIETDNVQTGVAGDPPREVAGAAAYIQQAIAALGTQQTLKQAEVKFADPGPGWRVVPDLVPAGVHGSVNAGDR